MYITIISKQKPNQTLTIKKGLWAGLYQCLALFPGMSRSGSTIAGGLLLGLTRESAVRLSFLLSLPIIFGSGAKKVLDVIKSSGLACNRNWVDTVNHYFLCEKVALSENKHLP